MSILKTIGHLIVGALISVGIIATPATPVAAPVVQPQNLGAAITQGGALYDGFLASGIASNATNMTLTSGSFKDGTALSGWNCFTVDANSPSIEYICGTASGTIVSSLVRGVGVVNPNTTSSALAFYHGRGAPVQITDYPDLQILKRILNGTDAVPNTLFFSAHTPCSSLASSTAVDYNCVSQVATSGAPDAGIGSKGLVSLSTKAQTAAGTATSSATTYLVVPNAYFNATSSATTTVVVTNASGTISPSFVSSTNRYAFTGGLDAATATSSATSTDSFNLLPAGIIQMYAASTTAPAGWLFANGAELATSSYPRLFTVIGYTYGGSTSTFKLPNFAGRDAIGFGSATSSIASLGQTGGEITHTQTQAEVAQTPVHINVNSSGSGSGGSEITNSAVGKTTNSVDVIDTIGSSTPFNVMDPYIVISFIIKF